jgi:hypothetical protein
MRTLLWSVAPARKLRLRRAFPWSRVRLRQQADDAEAIRHDPRPTQEDLNSGGRSTDTSATGGVSHRPN